MLISLYKFDKKPNSTKRPTGSAPVEADCIVKDNCSIINPRLEFTDGLNPNYINHNYIYIPSWKRYYFINDWSYEGRKWVASCTVDVMATARTEIGNTDLYMLRCANTSYHDYRVTDNGYPLKSIPEIKRSPSESFTHLQSTGQKGMDLSRGCVILGVSGKANNNYSIGMSNFYVINSTATFKAFSNYLYNNSNFSAWDVSEDWANSNAKAYIDPLQYVISCKYMPVGGGSISSTSEHIKFGYYDSGVTTGILSMSCLEESVEIDIPKRTNNSNRQYMYDNPYAKYYLRWTPIGVIELPLKHVYDVGKIKLTYNLDLITGKGMCYISEGDMVLTQLTFNVGADIPLVQNTVNVQAKNNAIQSSIASTGSFIGGIVGAVTGGGAGALISGITNGAVQGQSAIASSEQANYPVIASSGGLGSFADYKYLGTPCVWAEYYDTVNEDNADHGKPSCKMAKPVNVGGYILGQDSHITGWTADENDMINTKVMQGFYFE